MEVGDRRTELIHYGDCSPTNGTGTVEYIHPAHKFYVVAFSYEKGTVRESYLFPGHGRTEADDIIPKHRTDDVRRK